MGRTVKDWSPVRADAIEPAPHRYLWSGAVGANGQPLGDIAAAPNYADARACIPYSEGEVVYIARGGKAVRALIYRVLIERNRYGERRELYRVQVETRVGLFSKLWEDAHPGFVQRGYQAAGLAPDVPQDAA